MREVDYNPLCRSYVPIIFHVLISVRQWILSTDHQFIEGPLTLFNNLNL